MCILFSLAFEPLESSSLHTHTRMQKESKWEAQKTHEQNTVNLLMFAKIYILENELHVLW